MPRSQLENFVRAGYYPLPKQLLFHAACRAADGEGPTEVGFGGARGPGKSHAMFAQMALDDCQRFEGLKCLLLRRTGKAMRESAEDLRVKVLRRVPHTYNRTTGTITFPSNGSRIILGHYRNESDIDDKVGLEYDLVGIEECTTLSGQKYKLIRTCCRTSKDGWRPRMYSNANPGGIGHQFYLRHFVRGGNGTAFIAATYKDNPYLDAGYIKSLEGLTGWLRRAWLEGDWNIHAGTYFTTFTDKHVVEPFEVSQLGWTFTVAMDYGWTHPSAFLLLGEDNRGRVHFIDGYAASRRLPEAHHNKLLEMLGRWKLVQGRVRSFIIGADAWRPNEEGVTVADQYKKLGWRVVQAKMSRVLGATELLRRLGDEEAGIKATASFFNTCGGLIEQLPTLQHDPLNPEDVLKVNVDDEGEGGDDWYDTCRYAVMSLASSRAVSFGTLSLPR